jgi:hypothetical protein
MFVPPAVAPLARFVLFRNLHCVHLDLDIERSDSRMELDAHAGPGSFEAGNPLLQELEMPDPRDSWPLDDFQRNALQHLARLRETGEPAVLTVDGRSELVVQSAEAYQQILDRIEQVEAALGIRLGREDLRRGDTLPLDEAFQEIRETAGRRRT